MKKEILLARCSVPAHTCKGYDCDFCEENGIWEQGEEIAKSIDNLLKSKVFSLTLK